MEFKKQFDEIEQILTDHTKAILTKQPFSYEFNQRIERLISQSIEEERARLVDWVTNKHEYIKVGDNRVILYDDLIAEINKGDSNGI